MPHSGPGDSLSSSSDVGRKAYFVWRATHPAEARELPDSAAASAMWAAAFREGGWDALHRTSRIAELTQRLEDVINLYRDVEVEREFAAASAYWRTGAVEALAEAIDRGGPEFA